MEPTDITHNPDRTYVFQKDDKVTIDESFFREENRLLYSTRVWDLLEGTSTFIVESLYGFPTERGVLYYISVGDIKFEMLGHNLILAKKQ